VGVLRTALIGLGPMYGNAPAVADPDETLSYADLDAAANGAAGTLRALCPDIAAQRRLRVAIVAKNSVSYLVALLAAFRAEAVPFLVDPSSSGAEFERIVAACGLDLALHDPDSQAVMSAGTPVGEIRELAVTAFDSVDTLTPDLLPETEICRFTSGSTKFPGCVEFSGQAVRNAATAWTSASGLSSGDRILCFAGLYNGLAFNTSVIPGLLAGASLWLPRGLPSAGNVRRYLARVAPQVLVGFPALYDGLARTRFDDVAGHGIRTALSSAARLSEATAENLDEWYSLRVADYYGIAEVGPLTFNRDPAPGGGQGEPLPGVELRLDPPDAGHGELLVRSSSMGSRYLNYPGVFESRLTADGFYRTGDEGAITGGRLTLSGRTGKGINIGGRKISPDEVTEVLMRHPAVADCHVFAVVTEGPAPVLAAVVATDRALNAADLRSHCLQRLAAHKVPERIVLVAQIPRGGAGKPLVAQMTAMVRRA
jgi:acyl-CoA synthetase (AMP-forming)/AMP-acid ligase II